MKDELLEKIVELDEWKANGDAKWMQLREFMRSKKSPLEIVRAKNMLKVVIDYTDSVIGDVDTPLDVTKKLEGLANGLEKLRDEL